MWACGYQVCIPEFLGGIVGAWLCSKGPRGSSSSMAEMLFDARSKHGARLSLPPQSQLYCGATGGSHDPIIQQKYPLWRP